MIWEKNEADHREVRERVKLMRLNEATRYKIRQNFTKYSKVVVSCNQALYLTPDTVTTTENDASSCFGSSIYKTGQYIKPLTLIFLQMGRIAFYDLKKTNSLHYWWRFSYWWRKYKGWCRERERAVAVRGHVTMNLLWLQRVFSLSLFSALLLPACLSALSPWVSLKSCTSLSFNGLTGFSRKDFVVALKSPGLCSLTLPSQHF